MKRNKKDDLYIGASDNGEFIFLGDHLIATFPKREGDTPPPPPEKKGKWGRKS